MRLPLTCTLKVPAQSLLLLTVPLEPSSSLPVTCTCVSLEMLLGEGRTKGKGDLVLLKEFHTATMSPRHRVQYGPLIDWADARARQIAPWPASDWDGCERHILDGLWRCRWRRHETQPVRKQEGLST